MKQYYTITEKDFAEKEKKNHRVLEYFKENGLKVGDRWNASEYIEWVNAHYTFDK